MTGGRPIHDCPHCGRTKFADETLPCCVDDLFAMRIEWQRQKDARDWPIQWVRDGRGRYMDLTDWAGQ